ASAGWKLSSMTMAAVTQVAMMKKNTNQKLGGWLAEWLPALPLRKIALRKLLFFRLLLVRLVLLLGPLIMPLRQKMLRRASIVLTLNRRTHGLQVLAKFLMKEFLGEEETKRGATRFDLASELRHS